MLETYNLFIDTNFIRKGEQTELELPLSTTYIKSLLDFRDKNKIGDRVKIIIPEMVIKEMVSWRVDAINQQIESLNNTHNKYKKHFNIDGIDIEKFNKYDYRKEFEEKCMQFVKKHKITIAKIPEINVNNLIERAITKKPPFSGKDKKGDKGFKDTIIWYSIIAYCKDNKEATSFLCTDDTDIKKEVLNEELKKLNGKGLTFLSEPQEIIEKLTVKLKLEKESWQKEIEAIKDTVRRKLGIIIEELYKKNYQIGESSMYYGVDSISSRQIISYEIENIRFIEVWRNVDRGSDEVTLRLELRPKDINDLNIPPTRKKLSSFDFGSYEEPLPITPSVYGSTLSTYTQVMRPFTFEPVGYKNTVEIEVKLKVNRHLEEIEIVEMKPQSPLFDPFYRIS